MDFQKLRTKKPIFLTLGSLLVILLVAFLIYRQPLLSGKPLGLDAMGHLSKIAYINEFGLGVQWDLAWYNGAPFLAYYSPLYYQLGTLFSNMFLGSNLLSFLGILLTGIGVFFLINFYSKERVYSLIFSLFFLSVLCTSYYFIAVGNHPYVFGLFTIPFTILFLERSIENKKFNFLIYSFFFLLAYLTHIFMAFILFFLVGLRILLKYFFSKKRSFYNLLIEELKYLFIPLLLSCFWFLPFLSKTKSFIGDGIGYIPSLSHLFGFGNYIIWGKAPGEIGILFGILILFLSYAIKNLKGLNEKESFLIISTILLFFLTEGILGRFYPTGVGAIRFIVPFAIFSSILCGTLGGKFFKKNKKILGVLLLLLVVALILNYKVIQENYTDYSYSSNYDRYGMLEAVYSEDSFPLTNDFSNHRFGTSRYIFAETLNYKFPWQSQTWGYFDQGIIYPQELERFREVVWRSERTEETISLLDANAIRYFEVGGEDLKFDKKFNQSSLFQLVLEKRFSDYSFKIYEYLNYKPIIGIVLPNKTFVAENLVVVMRENPDQTIVKYLFSGKEAVSFKESYHSSWKAKTASGEKVKIAKTPEGFMEITPPKGTETVFIYQGKTILKILGIIFSIVGVILCLGVSKEII